MNNKVESTKTEQEMIYKATKMVEEVVPGNNFTGTIIPSQPELLIKKKGKAVVSVKITLTFELDADVLEQKQSYGVSYASVPKGKATNNGN